MTVTRYISVLCIVLLLGISAQTPTAANDLENGKKLAEQCTVCHGENGIGVDATVPNIAGQSAVYLESTMLEYREGIRENPLMNPIAAELEEDEIKDLAAWYSSFQIEVTVPRIGKSKFYKAKPPLR